MIEVELPDGTVAEFPDGTPQNVIQSALQRHAAPQESGLGAATIGFADASTLGFADEILGGVHGTLGTFQGDQRPFGEIYREGRDKARTRLQNVQEQRPGAFLTGQIGGGLATAALHGGAVARGAGFGQKIARGAGAGAVYGGVYGAGSAETPQQIVNEAAKGSALGLGLGGLGAGLGHGAGRIAQKLLDRKTIKGADSTQKIFDEAKGLFRSIDNEGIVIARPVFEKFQRDLAQDLGINEGVKKLYPNLFQGLRAASKVTKFNPTFGNVREMMDHLEPALSSKIGKERRLATQALTKFRSFLDNLQQGDLVAGSVAAAKPTLDKANRLFHRASKADRLDKALLKAERRAGASGSGGNIDNAIRSQIRQMLENPKAIRGFTDPEKDIMELIVSGSRGQNLARQLGKMSPIGNGLMQTLSGVGGAGAAGLTGNPLFMAPAAVGAVSKVAADKATPKRLELLNALIRNDGALPQADTERLEAIIRALVSRQTPAISNQ